METTISESAVKREKEAGNQKEYYKNKRTTTLTCKMCDRKCVKCTYLLAIFLDSC